MVSPVVKEWLVMVPLWLHQFANGIVLAYPAVLTPALTTVNGTQSSFYATKDEASWISASYSITGSLGFLWMPSIMQIYGRKTINYIINFILIIGWVVTILSSNVPSLIAGRAIHGLAFASLHINCIITSEYSHPKRRASFIVIKNVATAFGEIFCHGLGFSISWRLMALLGIIPALLAIVATIFWPESPSWFAYKGRYDECASTFKWLRGTGPEAKMELQKIILAQQEMQRIKKLEGGGCIARLFFSLKSKELMRPLGIVLVAVVLAHACGRHYLISEVTNILMSLTENVSQAYYYTIASDVLKILALTVSTYVVRKFTRRTLLLNAGYLASFLLGTFCLVDLLVSHQVISIRWISPLLLILFNIVCYIGVIPLAMVLKGELFPLEYKGTGATLAGVASGLCSMILLKMTPMMIDVLKPHGTFAIYLLIAVSCLICLHCILPETKDRTLQDIELDFTNIKISSELEGEQFIDKVCKS